MLSVFYYLVYFTFVIRMFIVDIRQENMVEWIETLEKNVENTNRKMIEMEDKITTLNKELEDKLSDVESCTNIVKSRVFEPSTEEDKNKKIEDMIDRLEYVERILNIDN